MKRRLKRLLPDALVRPRDVISSNLILHM